MADDNRATCGKTTITYPKSCSYVCYCTPQSGCTWAVTCGTWTTGGKGLTAADPGGGGGGGRPRPPSVTVAGKLDQLAVALAKVWKRPVAVPPGLRGKAVRKRTIKGTPEDVAAALGLELRPKRRPARQR